MIVGPTPSVVTLSVLESLPFANVFSPRTFNAYEVLLSNPVYVYAVVTLVLAILPFGLGTTFVSSTPSLKGAYCRVTTVLPTIDIVIELVFFEVKLIVGVAGVLLVTFDISPLLSICAILLAVVSNKKCVPDAKSPPGRKFVFVVPVELAKTVSPLVKSSFI